MLGFQDISVALSSTNNFLFNVLFIFFTFSNIVGSVVEVLDTKSSSNVF